MANICAVCGKKTVIGSSQKHRRGVAGKRWKNRVTPTRRAFKVNLQKITITENGVKKQIKICAKCLKRKKKNERDALLQA